MIERSLRVSKERSFFIFGARGTGKSTYLRTLFDPEGVLWLDLLDADLEARLLRQPSLLRDLTAPLRVGQWVVIDEVQKVPKLLSVIHLLIREAKLKFALTGSSARKLKREGADLLAGRANWYSFFPLTHLELGEGFSLDQVLHFGTLPETLALSEPEKVRYLRSYCQTYLKEEVLQEQLVRRVQPFREFLTLAAVQNGQILNYAKFAREVGSSIATVQSYFEILEDTLVGFLLNPFHESVRKRQRSAPKFYFFDLGVTRALSQSQESRLMPGTGAYGKAFEHFVILEVHRWIHLHEKDWSLSYLMTQAEVEIDLIIEKSKRDRWVVEIKSTDRVDEVEVRKLERIGGDVLHSKIFYVSRDPIERRIGSVHCLPWDRFLNELGE